MKIIKINTYGELEKIKEIKEKKFIIDLEDCTSKQCERIIDFMCGLTFLNGSMRKLNKNEYEIKINN